jgi:uncharacterized protein
MTSETAVRAAMPYGPVGLILSLACTLVLAAAYALVPAGLLALGEAVLFGRSQLLATLQSLRALGQVRDASGLLLAYSAAILVYLAIAAAILTLARFRGGADWRRLVAWEAGRPWARSRLYWGLVVAAILYGALASAAISKVYPPSKDWFTLAPGLSMLLISFVLVVAAGPFSEELLFRGWIYTSLRSRLGSAMSVAVSALLFALAHYEHTHLYTLAVLPVGLILGAIRERSGTIWATIALHALYNFSGWLATALGSG